MILRAALLTLGTLALTSVGALANQHTIRVGQVDSTSFPTINVYVSVTDAAGKFIPGLAASNFRVWEDGAQILVQEASSAEALTVVLVIDRSGSMAESGKLDAAKRAALAYVSALRPTDRVALIDFDLTANAGGGLAEDRARVSRRISDLRPNGGTGLFDATYTALEMLRPVKGRKAALVLTDGIDSGRGRSLEQVLEVATKDATSVFTIGLGTPSSATAPGDVDEAVLKAMASSTNGEYLHAPRADELVALYERISARLSSEYLVRYQSPRAVKDGTRRGVEVSVVLGTAEQHASASYLVSGILGAGSTNWLLFGALLAALVALLHPGGVPAVLEGKPVSLRVGRPQRVATGVIGNTHRALQERTPVASGGSSPPPVTSASSSPARSAPQRALATPPQPAKLLDATGRIYLVSRPSNTLGRAGSDISFVDSSVATVQARIEFSGDAFLLIDVAGTTKVNGRLPPREGITLNNGDAIAFGRRELTFRA